MRKYIAILGFISIFNLCAQNKVFWLEHKLDTLDFGHSAIIIDLPYYMIKKEKTFYEDGIARVYPFPGDSSAIVIDNTVNNTYKHYYQRYPNAKVNVYHKINKDVFSWKDNNLHFREDYYTAFGQPFSIYYINVTESNKNDFNKFLDLIKIIEK